MSYSLSDPAERDVRAIYVAGVRDFGLAHADRYFDELFDRFEFLSTYPEVARLRTEVEPPVRAYPFKAHVILYDVQADRSVLIVRVHHGRENWQTNARGEGD